jgi:hypothetical protein
MHRPTAVALCLLVLAGCNGVTTFDDQRATLTPAPVPTPTGAESGTSGLPPGVTGSGITDLDRLERAHRTALSSRSYTWRARRNVSEYGQSGVGGLDIRRIARVQNESTYEYRSDSYPVWHGGQQRYLENYVEFADGSGNYASYVDPQNITQYERVEDAPARERVGREAISAIDWFLDVENATVSVVRNDGRRQYELRGTGHTFVNTQPVSNYSVRALIRSDGLVQSLTAQYDRGSGIHRQSVRYSFEYTALGNTTVERPTWARERFQSLSTTSDPVQGE